MEKIFSHPTTLARSRARNRASASSLCLEMVLWRLAWPSLSTESLHLSIQVSNLLLKVGHGRLVVVDVMVISCQTGIFMVQGCTGPIGEENILVATVLHTHIWFEGKKLSDVKRERVEVSCIKKGKMIVWLRCFSMKSLIQISIHRV